MNKLEVADLIEQIPQELTPDDFLVALATKAEEAEREACAKKVDEEMDGWINTAVNVALNNVAAAIRARGEK